jgi:phage baseplate assembly protein W
MADVAHWFGGDLSISPTGDIATATGATLGQQRVLRRLLTNPGDYIWQPDYGAGLGRFVGLPVNAAQIAGVVQTQMALEGAVAQIPTPSVAVQGNPNGSVYLSISYTDANTGDPQVLSFTVGTAGQVTLNGTTG